VIDESIAKLLRQKKDAEVLQTIGYWLKSESSVVAINVTTLKQYFILRKWDNIRHMIGNHLFQHLYENYLIFTKSKDGSLVQIAGVNIFSYLKNYKSKKEEELERKQSKCDKYNIRN